MTKNNRSSVKNYQTNKVIREMYEKCFNRTSENITITILKGGMKNAVYLVEDIDRKVVLKISPKDESKMITVDRNILWWEAEMLKLFSNLDIPTPKLLAYDDTCSLCESPYLFMTYIDGQNYLQCKEKLTDEEKVNIEYQLGEISHKICQIKGTKFFLPSKPNVEFKDNYEFVLNLFDLLLKDALAQNIDLGSNGYSMIYDVLHSNKDSLNNITDIRLCHTDIWDGNILINNGNVVGIVDLADLYYCDELMTFYFHTIDGKTSEHFLQGFNNRTLNKDEKIRIEIYRMYVILKMIVDCVLKQYGRFDWMYENLNTRITSLSKCRK